MKKYLVTSILIILVSSCTTLGYDPHIKPIPQQDGTYISLKIKEDINDSDTVIPQYSIEKPINHESGWDNDDIVIVFRSPLISYETIDQINWGSDSSWTKFRLKTKPPFGYAGSFSARVIDGELRIYCGSKGQFLVNLKTIYLIVDLQES